MAQPRDNITEAFQLFDMDGDGYLAVHEASTAIRALGHVLTDSEISQILRRIGVDGRGRVDLNKFRQMHQAIPPQNYCKLLEDAFKTVDKDDSGFMMASELRHLLTNMGDKLGEEDFKALVEEMEVDSNGRIVGKELMRLLAGK